MISYQKKFIIAGVAMLSTLSLAGCMNHSKVHSHPSKIQSAKQNQIEDKKATLDYANQVASTVGGFGSKTTGGSKATKKNTYVVYNNIELRNALIKNTHNKPRKIIIKGTINANKDNKGNVLNDVNYIKQTKKSSYNMPDYLRAFSPKAKEAVKANRNHMEKARARVAKTQAKQIKFNVPANTTIMGAPKNEVKGAEFNIENNNVIIRNLNIESPIDDFPSWNQSEGKWEPQYSAISIKGAKNIWLDHNSMTDEPHIYNKARHLGARYSQHKDFVNANKGVQNMTVSNNEFSNHRDVAEIDNKGNKQLSSVTFAHNLFLDTSNKMPSMQNSNVDLLNNEYAGDNSEPYKFNKSWLLGNNSHVYAQDNNFIFHAKNAFGKYVANVIGGKYFSNKNMKKNDAKARALTKKQEKHMKPQLSFNHIIKNISHGFGANLK